MLYFADYKITKVPIDASTIVYLNVENPNSFDNVETIVYPYWTFTSGEDVQGFVWDNKITEWGIISNNPAKYTTLVADSRFIKE